MSKRITAGFMLCLVGSLAYIAFQKQLPPAAERDLDNLQKKSQLEWEYESRVARIRRIDDTKDLGYTDFPCITRWHIAKIEKVSIIENSPSIAIKNDLVMGLLYPVGSDFEPAKSRPFSIRFDAANLPCLAHEIVVGGWWYIGIGDNDELFDVYIGTGARSKAIAR